MKLRPATCVLGLEFIVAVSRHAVADPIQYVAEVYGAPWVSVGTEITVDPSAGGTYTLDSTSLISPYQFLLGTNGTSSLNSTGYVYLGAYVPSGSSPGGTAWVQIGVTVPSSGMVSSPSNSNILQGGDSGTGFSPGFAAGSATSGVDVPPLLLDLIADPGRIHIQATVTGGPQNDLVTTLTIDPLSVPEPTATCVLVAGIAGTTWLRRKRATLAREARTENRRRTLKRKLIAINLIAR
jgi:hypothetical protein